MYDFELDTDIQEAIWSPGASLASDNGQNRASGVLFKRAGRYFLATARHFLDRMIDKASIRLVNRYCSIAAVPPVVVNTKQTAPGDSDSDLDLLVCELGESTAKKYSPGWLADSQILSGPASLGVTTLIVGYPDQSTELNGGWGITTAYVHVAPISQVGLEDNNNFFFVTFDPTKSRALNGTAVITDPHGLSGGGVYLLYEPRVGAPSIQDRVRLIGIQVATIPIEGTPTHNLMCVRSEFVLSLADAIINNL